MAAARPMRRRSGRRAATSAIICAISAYLAARRNCLAGRDLSFADLAAAAELSCIDYLGEVPWEEDATAKAWYARMKSRPSFRPLLTDHVRGNPPPTHYADLDF